jgi:hypothetical protein
MSIYIHSVKKDVNPAICYAFDIIGESGVSLQPVWCAGDVGGE